MRRWLPILLICFLSACSLTALADGAVTRVLGNDVPQGLTVIATVNRDILRGDPVSIVVRIDNGGTSPVTVVVPQIVPPDQTTVLLGIKGPDEDDFRPVKYPGIYRGSLKGRAAPTRFPAYTIPAGQAQSFRLQIGWEFNPANEKERRWLFPVAGDYMVRVTVWVLNQPAQGLAVVLDDQPSHPVESEPVLVRVADPRAEVDILAVEELLRLRDGWLFYGPTFADITLPKELLDFRISHPDSRYLPFTELAVIRSEFWAAIVARDKPAARRAWDRARQAAEQSETFDWPDGWRLEAERLSRTMSQEIWNFLP